MQMCELDIRVRALVLAVGLAVVPVLLRGAQHQATFHGNLFPYVATMPGEPVEECRFMLVGEGDSDSLYLMGANNDAYLCAYLGGTKRLTVLLIPEP